LFGRDVWLRPLADAGFEPDSAIKETAEDRTPRESFIGRRPHCRRTGRSAAGSQNRPPIDDKANVAVCGIVAALTAVPHRDVHIVSGHRPRDKTVRVAR